MYIYIYIYTSISLSLSIYIYREREREIQYTCVYEGQAFDPHPHPGGFTKLPECPAASLVVVLGFHWQWGWGSKVCPSICIYIYIYTHIHVYTNQRSDARALDAESPLEENLTPPASGSPRLIIRRGYEVEAGDAAAAEAGDAAVAEAGRRVDDTL